MITPPPDPIYELWPASCKASPFSQRHCASSSASSAIRALKDTLPCLIHCLKPRQSCVSDGLPTQRHAKIETRVLRNPMQRRQTYFQQHRRIVWQCLRCPTMSHTSAAGPTSLVSLPMCRPTRKPLCTAMPHQPALFAIRSLWGYRLACNLPSRPPTMVMFMSPPMMIFLRNPPLPL